MGDLSVGGIADAEDVAKTTDMECIVKHRLFGGGRITPPIIEKKRGRGELHPTKPLMEGGEGGKRTCG